MRMMIKFALPVEASNAAIRTGKLQKIFQQLAEDLKPEAGYCFLSGGERSGFFVVDIRESSQVAEIAERLFFGVNAKIELVPVVTADDLRKGLSGVQAPSSVTAGRGSPIRLRRQPASVALAAAAGARWCVRSIRPKRLGQSRLSRLARLGSSSLRSSDRSFDKFPETYEFN